MRNKRRFQTTANNRASLEVFERGILIACENCGKCATIESIASTQDVVPTRRLATFTCSHCGTTRQLLYPVDPGNSLPLWLVTNYRGKRLWAFNEQHLDWLEDFIGAELRDDKLGHGSSGLHAILPPWMTSSKNRTGVMKGLARLREKLTMTNTKGYRR